MHPSNAVALPAAIAQIDFGPLFESHTAAMLLIDSGTGGILDVNVAAARFYCYPREHMRGMHISDINQMPPGHVKAALCDAASGARFHFEFPHRLASGETRWVQVSSSGINHGGARLLLSIITDITLRYQTAERLRLSEQRFRDVVEAAGEHIWELDLAFCYTYLSEHGLRTYGYGLEQMIGRTPASFMPPGENQRVDQWIAANRSADGSFRNLEHRAITRTGDSIWLRISSVPVRNEGGGIIGFRGAGLDITAPKRAEEALQLSEQRFRDIVEAAGEYVWESGQDHRFTYLSPRIESVMGYRPAEMTGHQTDRFVPAGEDIRIRHWLAANAQADGLFRDLELQAIHKNGQIVWHRVSGVAVRNGTGVFTGHRGTGVDITARKQAEERIEYLATRDVLTGLPNRLLLTDRAGQAIAAAARSKEKLALLFLDLDRFKHINDSLGHHTGDALLCSVATRLTDTLRRTDTLARLGGDEFVILLEGLHDTAYAASVAGKVCADLAHPFTVAGQTLNTSSSVGISIYPDDGGDFGSLLKNADAAMYHAKEQGRANYQFFSESMNQRALDRLYLERDLRLALECGDLRVHLQPVMSIDTGAINSAEALLRWQHPARGLLLPGQFIETAEETGLIRPIGAWVIGEVCRLQRQWADAGLGQIPVAVNVSVSQLMQGDAFVTALTAALAQHRLNPACIEIEITESLLMKNVEAAAAVLRVLSGIGVRISVDDFGTGYSSLAYLKRLPLDTLKVDREFVRDIDTDADDREIVRTIILLAHSLNLRVIAEGVESAAQLAQVKLLGADEYQGYLHSEPLPPGQFAVRFLAPAPVPEAGLRERLPV